MAQLASNYPLKRYTLRIGLKQIVLALDGVEWNMTSIHLKVNRFTFLHNYRRVDLNRQDILLHCFSHFSILENKNFIEKRSNKEDLQEETRQTIQHFSNTLRELMFANFANFIFYNKDLLLVWDNGKFKIREN